MTTPAPATCYTTAMPLPATTRLLVATAASALLLAATDALASTDFVIAPYLQHLATNRVQVRFQVDEPAPATVELRAPGAAGVRRYEDKGESEFHDVTVDGLTAGTTYSYTVRVGERTTAPATFTTAPADAAKPFTFLLAGDNRDDPDVYADLVQWMLRIPSDFLVHTGDLVPRGSDLDAWEEYFRVAQPLLAQRCEFVAIGNHDLSGKGAKRREPFLQFFASPDNPLAAYYTFRWGNSRFFVLDSQDTWEADERPWLKERLESADTEEGIAHRIVVLHHSPFSTGMHGPDRGMRSAGILHMLLEHHVDLVLGGHDHMYERDQYGGIKYIISGGGGAPLYDVTPRATGRAYTSSIYHLVEVHVDGEKVSVTARDTKGQAFDSAAYEATGPWMPTAPAPIAGAGQHGAVSVRPVPPRASSCGCSVPGTSSRSWAAAGIMGLLAWGLSRRARGSGRRGAHP